MELLITLLSTALGFALGIVCGGVIVLTGVEKEADKGTFRIGKKFYRTTPH